MRVFLNERCGQASKSPAKSLAYVAKRGKALPTVATPEILQPHLDIMLACATADATLHYSFEGVPSPSLNGPGSSTERYHTPHVGALPWLRQLAYEFAPYGVCADKETKSA